MARANKKLHYARYIEYPLPSYESDFENLLYPSFQIKRILYLFATKFNIFYYGKTLIYDYTMMLLIRIDIYFFKQYIELYFVFNKYNYSAFKTHE